MLSQNLTSEQIEDDVIAKLNTFAYRKMSMIGSGGKAMNDRDISKYIQDCLSAA